MALVDYNHAPGPLKRFPQSYRFGFGGRAVTVMYLLGHGAPHGGQGADRQILAEQVAVELCELLELGDIIDLMPPTED